MLPPTAINSNYRWADIAYRSIAYGMPLQDVYVTTARCDYVNLVFEAAATSLIESNQIPSMRAISLVAQEAVDDVNLYVTERVRVHDDVIEVVINAELIDDEATDRIHQMVVDALLQLSGELGEIHFSSPMQFDISDELHACH